MGAARDEQSLWRDPEPGEARIFLDRKGRGVMGSGKNSSLGKNHFKGLEHQEEGNHTKPESSSTVQAYHLFSCSKDLKALQYQNTSQPAMVANVNKASCGEAEAGEQGFWGRDVLSY